jgi:hypothetical protein
MHEYDMNTGIALLLLVVFWTFARCAQIFGDLAKNLRKIEAQQKERLLDVEAQMQLNLFGKN